MVIGFDAKHMLEEEGILGFYGRVAVEALTEHFHHNDYILYLPGNNADTNIISHLLVHSSVHLKTPHNVVIGEQFREWSGLLQATRRHGVQVFHGLSATLPGGIEKSGMASVVTVGTFLHKHYPKRYSFWERFSLNRQFKTTLKVADAVIAMSEYSKRELVKFYHVPEEKIKVVMPVSESVFASPLADDAKDVFRQKYKLPEKYILVPGRFDDRNNMKIVLDAMARLDDKDLYMVVIGHHNDYYKELKAKAAHLGFGGRVVRVRATYNAPLHAVYAMATVVAYPSRYEVVSLPILRCLSCGTPVVAAKGSCMEEYGGDAALYFSPDSADELADALSRAMGAERARLLEAGKAQNEKFSSERMANQLNDLYRQLRATKEK